MTAPTFAGFGFVPWNAMWSGEEQYELRSCRFVNGKLAIWQPQRPGDGRPLFAKPHMVRQRRSIAEMRCTVCGERTEQGNQWWFKLGQLREGWFMTTEAPVHLNCARLALKVCPHLRGRQEDLRPMPGGFKVLSAVIGGDEVQERFATSFPSNRKVFGNLKIAWPERHLKFLMT